MTRCTSRSLIAFLLLAAAGSSAVGQPKYRLRRAHAFSVGTVVDARRTTDLEQTVRRLSDDSIEQEMSRTTTESIRIEVLEADEEGRPMRLRHRILKGRRTTRTTGPNGRTSTDTVELRELSYQSRRTGDDLEPDASTVKAPAGTGLTEEQISYVREDHIEDVASLPVCPPDLMVMLPGRAVAVGEEWVPSEAALMQYANRHPKLRKRATRVHDARFGLEQVRDGMAHIVGRFEMTGKEGEVLVRLKITMKARIDLDSGLCRGWTADGEFAWNHEGRSARGHVRNEISASLTAGTGVASAEPEGLTTIRLAAESALRPDGTYVNTKFGFRMRVPDGYRQNPEGVEGAVIASFKNDIPYMINITASEVPRGTSTKAFAAQVNRYVAKRLAQYEVLREEVVELPRGNSGCLITARFQRGRFVMQTLILLGDRSATKAVLFGISAAAKANDTAHIEVIRAALLTAAAKPPRPQGEDD